MSETRHDSDAQHTLRGLKQFLTPRQAKTVLDPSQPGALYLGWDAGREVWVRGLYGDSLYAVGYGTGGGLYMNRTLPVGRVQRLTKSADTAQVVDTWDLLPDALTRGP